MVSSAKIKNESHQKLLEKGAILQSIYRKDNCTDNSIMKSFFEKLKNDNHYCLESTCRMFEEFYKTIDKYISRSDKERI